MHDNYTHFPYIPDNLKRLEDLAYNLWFSWHSRALRLFRTLDDKLWRDVYHNPVKLLHQIDPGRLKEVARDESYMSLYQKVIDAFDHYMSEESRNTSWFGRTYPEFQGGPAAYLSMEFGIHECLPIYSGGLGILAGDHLKSASDLGIPIVGIGLLYRESYFTQFISMNGNQQAVYLHNDFSTMALNPVKGSDDELLTVRVKLDHREIAARLWKAQVGRVPLYLLDTDFAENKSEDREITERLYVADRDHRLVQEILLGMGGVAALNALGVEPSVWHMNEGHSALLGIERIKQAIYGGVSFDEAREQVRKTMVFTTHTPVVAGNEVFERGRIEHFLKTCWESMDLKGDEIVSMAQESTPPDTNAFNMTILALNLSSKANAVSELHGQVARRMWHPVWPDRIVEDVPITSITNGIHTRTWMVSEMKNLLDETPGSDWRYALDDPDFWKRVDEIPDEALWRVHEILRGKLVRRVRYRLTDQRERNGEEAHAVEEVERILDEHVLTIGFARRFAPYKRATLILQDRNRLRSILTNTERPVQILMAGKAHPANQQGKALIQTIYSESRNPEFQNRLVYIENYDMAFARRLVSGVDVWLNTPRRPMEASGTSGMKVAANGGLNLSILDGWWREGFDGTNGWAIGEDREYYNEYEQDWADSQSLYRLLEEEIVPLFYERNDDGIPVTWIARMKASMRSLIPQFNTDRMVQEYMTRLYSEAMH